MRWLAIAVMVASAWGGWNWWAHERQVRQPPGMIAPDAPRQGNIEAPPQFDERGHTFIVRARYDLTVRVLRKEFYRLDGGADLAPVDLAVGWGPMSDSRIVDGLEFSQMGRFFYWRPRDPRSFPLSPRELNGYAGQIHAIPGTPAVEKDLRRLRPGQRVTLGGWLVDVRGPHGFTWNTSLTREDTGPGACEVMWIERVDVD